MLPLLQGFGDGAEHASAASMAKVATHFSLSDEDLRTTLPSGQTTFANRWGWARTYMKSGPALLSWASQSADHSRRQTTPERCPVKIDFAILQKYPEFVTFQTIGRMEEQAQLNDPVAVVVEQTPSELMDGAYLALRKQVQSDLLAAAKKESAKRFEMLVLELLVAVGYGGSLHGNLAAQVTAASMVRSRKTSLD